MARIISPGYKNTFPFILLARKMKNRLVIRNLYYSVTEDIIKSDLAAKGHTDLNISYIRKRNDEPRSLFYLDLTPKGNNK